MPSIFSSPVRLRGSGGGASPGSAGDIDIYANAGVPSFSALRGSLCLNTTAGTLYENTSAAAAGATWTPVNEAGAALTTQGDLLSRNATGLVRIGAGTAGQLLTANGAGTEPTWQAGGGAVTPLFTAVVSSTVVANTTTRTVFDQTYTLPVNSLAVGDVLQFIGSGTTAAVTAAFSFDVSFGGTALAATADAVVSNNGWSVVAEVTVRAIGAAGTAQLAAGLTGGPIANTLGGRSVVTTGIDTTATNVLGVAVTMDTAGAGITAGLSTLTIRKINAP